MYTDPIANTYTHMIQEMAYDLGTSDVKPLDSDELRKKHYNEMSSMPLHKKINNDVTLHKTVNDNVTQYRTVDNKSKEFIHYSDFEENQPDHILKVKYDIQQATEKYKYGNLPKGYVTDLAYQHFLNSSNPLRSSDEQAFHGQKMWSKLVDRALHDNHNVYYSEFGSSLQKVNNDNKDFYLNQYKGKQPIHYHRHLILSKKELK